MDFSKHLGAKIKQAQIVAGQMRRIMGSRNVTSKVKWMIYASAIWTILTYGSIIWFNPTLLTKDVIGQANRFENKLIPNIAGLYFDISGNKFYSKLILLKQINKVLNVPRRVFDRRSGLFKIVKARKRRTVLTLNETIDVFRALYIERWRKNEPLEPVEVVTLSNMSSKRRVTFSSISSSNIATAS